MTIMNSDSEGENNNVVYSHLVSKDPRRKAVATRSYVFRKAHQQGSPTHRRESRAAEDSNDEAVSPDARRLVSPRRRRSRHTEDRRGQLSSVHSRMLRHRSLTMQAQAEIHKEMLESSLQKLFEGIEEPEVDLNGRDADWDHEVMVPKKGRQGQLRSSSPPPHTLVSEAVDMADLHPGSDLQLITSSSTRMRVAVGQTDAPYYAAETEREVNRRRARRSRVVEVVTAEQLMAWVHSYDNTVVELSRQFGSLMDD